MLNIQYFASIREALDRKQEQMEMPAEVNSVQALIDYLIQANPHFASVFAENNKVLVAVNKTVVARSHRLQKDDEVAFFPPMTGG
jgi:sulfur-carrier protein